ncbi:MAG TPA: Ig-like domain-containing protein, partial [Clostridia bacterium]|nr:Ig-like domain-containing protein [Clostridia bacterium]
NCPGSTATFAVNASGTDLAFQWFKGANALPGKTGNSLLLQNISSADAGTYSVVVSGTCGNAVTNSATLTVNQNVVVSTAPISLTNCPGSTATFAVNASGTDLAFQWFKGANALPGQTRSSLLLQNVSSADGGTYSVVVSGICGNAVTNSATLRVKGETTATPIAGAVKNAGETVSFSTTPGGAEPFTFTWRKDGTLLAGETRSSITISNVMAKDAGLYTVEVQGACNSAIQDAVLVLNIPPTANIVSPTNGAVFIAPANFTLLSEAFDVDGVVTNVEFYAGSNLIGQTNALPYFVMVTNNLPPGNYSFQTVATDDLGARGTSAPVTISVIERPPLEIVSSIRFNPRTGLYEQVARVTNPTYSTYDAVRIYAQNLTKAMRLYNASGTNGSGPFVQTYAAVEPGTSIDLILEYHVKDSSIPKPHLVAELVAPKPGGSTSVSGFTQHINRGVLLANRNFMLEFSSRPNRVYHIQYTSDLVNWKTAQPAIVGTGSWLQWVDNGQPKTETAPASESVRLYRIIMLP